MGTTTIYEKSNRVTLGMRLEAMPAPNARASKTRVHDRRTATVQAALLASGYRAVARLECELVEGSIILSGVVSSYYLKQVAQEAVMRLKIVQFVQNAVEVRP